VTLVDLAEGVLRGFGALYIVGAVFLLALSETLRVLVGNRFHGLDLLIYGALLILFIIYMPKGILGTVLARIQRKGPTG
jgi:branched-chain amino acid transport system permease protein